MGWLRSSLLSVTMAVTLTTESRGRPVVIAGEEDVAGHRGQACVGGEYGDDHGREPAGVV